MDSDKEHRRAETDETTDAPLAPPSPPKQTRLKAHLDSEAPFLTLDERPIATFDEAPTRFVARLIEANGQRVAFAEFVRENPEFRGMHAARELNKIPKGLQKYIDRRQGAGSRLIVDLLQ